MKVKTGPVGSPSNIRPSEPKSPATELEGTRPLRTSSKENDYPKPKTEKKGVAGFLKNVAKNVKDFTTTKTQEDKEVLHQNINALKSKVNNLLAGKSDEEKKFLEGVLRELDRCSIAAEERQAKVLPSILSQVSILEKEVREPRQNR